MLGSSPARAVKKPRKRIRLAQVLKWVRNLPIPLAATCDQPNAFQDGNLLYDIAVEVLRPDLRNQRTMLEELEAELEEAQSSENLTNEMQSLGMLADKYYAQGMIARAVEMRCHQLKLMKEHGTTEDLGMLCGKLGDLYVEMGDSSNAIKYHDTGLEIQRKMTEQSLNKIPLKALREKSKNLTKDFRKGAQIHLDANPHKYTEWRKRHADIASWNPAAEMLEAIENLEVPTEIGEKVNPGPGMRIKDVMDLIYAKCAVVVEESWPFRTLDDILAGNQTNAEAMFSAAEIGKAFRKKKGTSSKLSSKEGSTTSIGKGSDGKLMSPQVRRAEGEQSTVFITAVAQTPTTDGVKEEVGGDEAADELGRLSSEESMFSSEEFLGSIGAGTALASPDSPPPRVPLYPGMVTEREGLWLAWFLCFFSGGVSIAPPKDLKRMRQGWLLEEEPAEDDAQKMLADNDNDNGNEKYLDERAEGEELVEEEDEEIVVEAEKVRARMRRKSEINFQIAEEERLKLGFGQDAFFYGVARLCPPGETIFPAAKPRRQDEAALSRLTNPVRKEKKQLDAPPERDRAHKGKRVLHQLRTNEVNLGAMDSPMMIRGMTPSPSEAGSAEPSPRSVEGEGGGGHRSQRSSHHSSPHHSHHASPAQSYRASHAGSQHGAASHHSSQANSRHSSIDEGGEGWQHWKSAGGMYGDDSNHAGRVSPQAMAAANAAQRRSRSTSPEPRWDEAPVGEGGPPILVGSAGRRGRSAPGEGGSPGRVSRSRSPESEEALEQMAEGRLRALRPVGLDVTEPALAVAVSKMVPVPSPINASASKRSKSRSGRLSAHSRASHDGGGAAEHDAPDAQLFFDPAQPASFAAPEEVSPFLASHLNQEPASPPQGMQGGEHGREHGSAHEGIEEGGEQRSRLEGEGDAGTSDSLQSAIENVFSAATLASPNIAPAPASSRPPNLASPGGGDARSGIGKHFQDSPPASPHAGGGGGGEGLSAGPHQSAQGAEAAGAHRRDSGLAPPPMGSPSGVISLRRASQDEEEESGQGAAESAGAEERSLRPDQAAALAQDLTYKLFGKSTTRPSRRASQSVGVRGAASSGEAKESRARGHRHSIAGMGVASEGALSRSLDSQAPYALFAASRPAPGGDERGRTQAAAPSSSKGAASKASARAAGRLAKAGSFGAVYTQPSAAPGESGKDATHRQEAPAAGIAEEEWMLGGETWEFHSVLKDSAIPSTSNSERAATELGSTRATRASVKTPHSVGPWHSELRIPEAEAQPTIPAAAKVRDKKTKKESPSKGFSTGEQPLFVITPAIMPPINNSPNRNPANYKTVNPARAPGQGSVSPEELRKVQDWNWGRSPEMKPAATKQNAAQLAESMIVSMAPPHPRTKRREEERERMGSRGSPPPPPKDVLSPSTFEQGKLGVQGHNHKPHAAEIAQKAALPISLSIASNPTGRKQLTPDGARGVADKITEDNEFAWQRLDNAAITSISAFGRLVVLVAGKKAAVFMLRPFRRLVQAFCKASTFTAAVCRVDHMFIKAVFNVKGVQSSKISVDITEGKTVQNEDENFVVAGDATGAISVHSARNGAKTATLHEADAEGGAVTALKMVGGSVLLCASHHSGQIGVWDVYRQRLLWRSGVSDGALMLKVLPRWIVSKTEGGSSLYIWKVDYRSGRGGPHMDGGSGIVPEVLHQQAKVSSFACVQDPSMPLALPMVVAGSQDGTLQVWRPRGSGGGGKAGESVPELLFGHQGAVLSLFLPDTARLCSAAADAQVRVWDLSRGKCAAVLRGHQAAVTSVWCDERHVVSASVDGSIRVWLLLGAKCVSCLETAGKYNAHPPPIKELLVFPRPMAFAAFDSSGGVTVWNASASTSQAGASPAHKHKNDSMFGHAAHANAHKAKTSLSPPIRRPGDLTPEQAPLSSEWNESPEAMQRAAPGPRKAVRMWAGERSDRVIQLHPPGRPWEKLEIKPRAMSTPPVASHPQHRASDLGPVIPVWTAKGEFLPEIHGGKFSREALRGREVLRSAMANDFAKELERQVGLLAHGGAELAMTRAQLQLLHAHR